MSEGEKNKKREYGRNRYHNMSEEKKQRLKECQKKYHNVKKKIFYRKSFWVLCTKQTSYKKSQESIMKTYHKKKKSKLKSTKEKGIKKKINKFCFCIV